MAEHEQMIPSALLSWLALTLLGLLLALEGVLHLRVTD